MAQPIPTKFGARSLLESSNALQKIDCQTSALPSGGQKTFKMDATSGTLKLLQPSSVVGRFLLQARQPGTRCQTISVIRC